MDAKVVNRELRARIRPLLKTAGFTKFTDRSAWFRREESTWIVKFQSFNSYLADGVGCTTFSFGVNLGLCFDFHRPSPGAPVLEWPKEYEATLRFNALKRLEQPFFNPYGRHPGRDRRDVFFVLEDGSNLDEVIDDAREVIEGDGLPTLRLYDNPLYTYCSLFDYARQWPPRSPSPQIEVMPPGNVDSPSWRDAVESFARRLGRDARADLERGLGDDLLDSVLGLR